MRSLASKTATTEAHASMESVHVTLAGAETPVRPSLVDIPIVPTDSVLPVNVTVTRGFSVPIVNSAAHRDFGEKIVIKSVNVRMVAFVTRLWVIASVPGVILRPCVHPSVKWALTVLAANTNVPF